MSATTFEPDLQDLRFVLFDQLDIDTSLKALPQYEAFDQDLYNSVIDEAARIATDVLYPINRSGDLAGVSLDSDGNVTTPEGYKAAWTVCAEGGWVGTSAPAEAGGMGFPHVIGVLGNELFTGGNMAFSMYIGLTAGVARLIHHFGPDGKRSELAQKMFSGEWGGTMCLTEADAGTAVGDNRCKALPTDTKGLYHLEGEKIFITGGDQDLTDNIIHLVLARTPDAPSGTKGLSLFIVPKFNFDENFNILDRNDAFVVSTEHKMGINSSATCVLALGAKGTCNGYLIGKEGDGMSIMFTLMNEARIGVGIQGVAAAAAAYGFAKSYAKDRVQGTSIANFKNPDAPRVAIIEHPDVRRNLMNQRVHVELMRSLVYRLALRLDIAENSDQETHDTLIGEVELLVPVVKSYCTDMGFQVTVDALQTFGGYGFTKEYPVEQYVRDAKIASIYEGTNGVQALDLLGRKLRMKGGAVFMEWLQQVQGTLAEASAEGFADQAEAVGKALNHLGATAMHLGGLGAQGKLDGAMLQAYPFLNMMGNVALAIEAIDQARTAKRLIEQNGETPFLKGKLLNLDYYVQAILPFAIAAGKAIQADQGVPLDDSLFA